MSYYIVKVYGLICDLCEATEEHVPTIDARHKLAEARRVLHADPASGWTRRAGKDLCPRCSRNQETR